MPGSLSTFTSLTAGGYPIPERSAATPGLWNNIFSTLSANLDTLNSSVSQFVNLSSVGTAQVVGGISSNTLRSESGSTILVQPYATALIAKSIDSGGAVFNVKAFGAVGNGITDDTVSINSAVQMAGAAGGTVYFPPGNYVVTSTISYASQALGVTFQGHGAWVSGASSGWGSRLVWAGANDKTASILSFGLGMQTSRFLGIGFNANSLAGFGLFIGNQTGGGTSDVLLENVQFNNALNAGLALGSTDTVNVNALAVAYQGIVCQSCVFVRNRIGALLNGANGFLTSFHDCDWNHGFYPSNMENAVVVMNWRGVVVDGGYLGVLKQHDAGASVSASTVGWGFLVLQNGDIEIRDLYCEHPAVLNIRASNSSHPTVVRNVVTSAVSSTGSSHATAVLFRNSGPAVLDSCSFDCRQVGIAESSTATTRFTAFNNDLTRQAGGAVAGGGTYSANSGYYVFDNESLISSDAYNFITIGNTRTFGSSSVTSGTALIPAMRFGSDESLGWYNSGKSAMGLSYGQLQLPAGSAVQPAYAFSSESSLGFYRSAASIIAQSYGVFSVNSLQANSGITISAQTWLWASNLRIANVNQTGSALEIIPTGTLGTTINANYFGGVGDINIKNISGGTIVSFQQALSQVQLGQFGTSTTPALAFYSEASLGWYRSGASTMALSYGSFNFNQSRNISMRTLAASSVTASAAKTNVAVDEVVFTVGGASGASLCIMSGGTLYFFNSAGSAAQA